VVKYVMSLEGQINYVRLFDPKAAARLRADLKQLRGRRNNISRVP
jgi:hypothetical protein